MNNGRSPANSSGLSFSSSPNAEDKKKEEQFGTIKNAGIAGGLTEKVSEQIKEADRRFAKPKTYDRSLVDYKTIINEKGNSVKINSKENLKDRVFSNKATVKDPYTGNDLLQSKDDAKLLYGDNYTEHTASSDHILPLDRVYGKNKDNPFITTDDIAQAANDDQNLAVTNLKLNSSKQEKTNEEYIEYAKEKNIELSDEAQQTMLEDSKQASKFIKKDLRKKTIANVAETAHTAGLEGAKHGTMIGGGMSIIRNAVAFAKGEKDAGEAALDTATDTVSSAALGYGTNAAGATIGHAMSSSSNTMLQTISKTGLPAQITVAALETGKTLKKYCCGEIDGTQCLTELGEKGTGMIASSAGAVIGQIAIPIPIIGGMIGGMIGYAFSSSYYNELVTILQNRKLAHEERIRIEAECNEAIQAMRQYRSEIERIAEAYFAEYTTVFNTAMSTIEKSLKSGDADGVVKGANTITKQLGGTVQYDSFEEFIAFMNDENADFIF